MSVPIGDWRQLSQKLAQMLGGENRKSVAPLSLPDRVHQPEQATLDLDSSVPSILPLPIPESGPDFLPERLGSMAAKKANRPRSAEVDAEWLYVVAHCIRRAEEEVVRFYPLNKIKCNIHLPSCFLRQVRIKYCEYDIVGNGDPNAELANDCSFFIGNHLQDPTAQIETLRRVLDSAVQ